MEARPMVDLPAPLSPIRPSTSPRLSSSDISSTSTRPLSDSIRRLSILRTDSTIRLHFRRGPGGARIDRQNPVDDKIDADGHQGDRHGWPERRGKAEADGAAIVTHHAAPVGKRRLNSEA